MSSRGTHRSRVGGGRGSDHPLGSGAAAPGVSRSPWPLGGRLSWPLDPVPPQFLSENVKSGFAGQPSSGLAGLCGAEMHA